MRKILLTCGLLLAAASLYAIPAKKGIWKTIKTADGREVRVRLAGDEHMHFWQAEDGTAWQNGNPADLSQLRQRARSRRQAAARSRSRKLPKTDKSVFQGEKKGLILLVEFSDTRFQAGHDQTFYDRYANEKDFTTPDGARGSVADYFLAQSAGQFRLTFDVVGPIRLSRAMEYYGSNDSYGNDSHPGQMVAEAVNAVKDRLDFSPYDWNNDGEVDQVYVLYAGKGEATSGEENTVWPHEWQLSYSDYGRTLSVGTGLVIDTYACGNEVYSDGSLSGIGTLCHEFSHCMGFPDMYDTGYNGYFGMGDWDLMDSGSYNGDGHRPAGYSSFEKMVCGWLEPVVLEEDQTVDNVKPLSDGGQSYIIYNEGHRDEFYMVENRQWVGWDDYLPGHGLLVLHVDYDEQVWSENIVNTVSSWGTDHEHVTIFHADNEDDRQFYQKYVGYSMTTQATDPYPFGRNDSLTNTSGPKAALYHPNIDGRHLMNKALRRINQNSDLTMSFNFRGYNDNTYVRELEPGTLFYESFDKCDGSGGNDGLFDGTVAGSTIAFDPDNDGWRCTASFGGYHCARFGSSSVVGTVYSPYVELTGDEMELSFLAAPYGEDGVQLNLITSGSAHLSTTSFALERGQWTECRATLTGTGRVLICFRPSGRFFLDEVKIKESTIVDGLEIHQADRNTGIPSPIYDLTGRQVSVMRKGVYIVNGRKYVK